MLSQVNYPMQFMVYENTYQQHFQRRYAFTELQCIEQLALEIMKEYTIWLGMTQVITSQRKINNWTRNTKFNLECSERLVFKPFLAIMIQNINVRTHLVLVGTGWPQELPVEHTVVAINDKNTWKNN